MLMELEDSTKGGMNDEEQSGGYTNLLPGKGSHYIISAFVVRLYLFGAVQGTA